MTEIKKISKNIYEIPKEGKMNVSVRIFASEKILENIKKDKTIEQAKNMACLQGVLNPIVVLSDAHQGYGACIGGVAVYDVDKGVISPGEIGYDINCLKGDSKILSEFGYYKEIKKLEVNSNESLNILEKNQIKLTNSKISLFMKKEVNKIYQIKTKSGNEIFATEEHPIYTKKGMQEIKELKRGDEVLMYPFDGVRYEQPKHLLLISEKDIDNLNKSQTSKLQIKNKLKSLGLLPLYSDNEKLTYILKIIGFVFGDGNLSMKKNTQTGFYGEIEDLNLIKLDLKKVGFDSCIFSRHRKHKIKTQYKEYEFERTEFSLHNHSASLAILLYLLGTPEGNKAKQDYKIPEWIMNSPKWYKRLFLASLFGAEMSTPKTMLNGFNFYVPVFSLNKTDKLHGIYFVNQISALLEELGVNSVLIKSREDEVNGKKSTRIRLMIKNDINNLINLYSKINYDYNLKKRKLANAAILWLNQKKRIIELRENSMNEAREMKKEGFSKSQIIKRLSCNYVNRYFLDKAIYHEEYGKSGSRIAFCFISFNEFLKNCYGDEGFIWDEIESINETEYNGEVYDITINNENHNFIAEGFVVSNCSVRLLKTNLKKEDVIKKQKEVVEILYKKIPSGVGRGSPFNITKQEFNKLLEGGAKYIVEKGFGVKEDYLHTEEEGNMKEADSSKVSERAIKRGIGQVGTLGAGNHFLEVQYVDEIFDEKVAKEMGISKGQVTIMVHCGSRGLGHQVASDYIKLMEEKYGFENLPDRELINAPIKSELGKNYYKAMCCASNFAFANKQLITHWIREEIKKLFPEIKIDVVYDVCHNIAKFEEHIVDGKKKMVCVHRKGATRCFNKQPVIIPGSMGTASYLLIGTKKAEELTFGSTVHGAGRVSSRSSALRNLKGEDIKKDLNKKGIEVKAGSMTSLAEEAPEAYKDIDDVVNVVDELGISKKVARMKPLVVVKG
ncbi:MAG: RtcB family protein [Nanoarchaeota archaeon]